MCRLRPAEKGVQATHTGSSDSPLSIQAPNVEKWNPTGSFQGAVLIHPYDEAQSQDLLLKDPRSEERAKN